MTDVSRKLVTIVTEAMLETELCEALSELGASGFTVIDARGSGSRGVRDAGWSSSGNVRIEVVCSDEIASSIGEYVRDKYYENYAMILFESDIRVLRSGKFS